MAFIWKYLKRYKKYVVINLVAALGFILIELGIPTLLAQVLTVGVATGDYSYIIAKAGQMLLFAAVGLVSLLILAYSTNRVTSNIIRDIRKDIFTHVQTFSHDERSKFGTSRLITSTGNDPFQIMQFLTVALRIGIMAPAMMIASFFMIFAKNKMMSMFILASIPLMLLGIYVINKKSQPLSIEQQSTLDDINLKMLESLTGLRVIRAFNNQGYMKNRFEEVNRRYMRVSIRMQHILAYAWPSFTIIFTLIMAGVVWFGSTQVQAGLLEFGMVSAFVEYVFHALFSFLMFAGIFMMYPRTAVSAGRIQRILETQPSIDSNVGGVTQTETSGYLEFKDVSFAYSDASEEPVIRNISFTAAPGETVAFIGSTGSGKSTLIQLIPRFFDVTSGEILIDGVSVKDYNLDALRRKVGYVPQKAVLFSGTIKENLLFGNENATMDEIEAAADIAQASSFIENRPNKYDEILSEGGINLSGGQKQRLCIARAVVRRPAIYVFDDSFSALDYKTDATLRERLKSETRNSAVLVVAQRVGTIMEADKILVIDEGRVVASGTHKELLKTSKIYYEIASSQLSKEELER